MNERDSHSSSRRAFLGKSALVGGGALALGAIVLPSLPARATDFEYGDARLLEFLLKVQALQSDYFATAALTTSAQGLTSSEANILNTLAKQDEQQKRWCKGALRKFAMGQGMPSTMSGGFHAKRYSFQIMKTRETLLRDALRLKTASASAWTGAAGRADDGEIAAAFASLAGVQNRHRALLAEMLGEPAIMAMAGAMSMRDATVELDKYGFSSAM